MNTNEDNLEFAVSQCVDGTLADHDRAALGARLNDADARAIAFDHEWITGLLRNNAPVPPVDFDAFADTFSAALASEPYYAPASLQMPNVAAARSPWTRRLAIASAIVLTGLAAWPLLPHRGAGPVATNTKTATSVVRITVASAPTAPPVTRIAIGPSESAVQKGYAMGMDTRPAASLKPRVMISSVDVQNDLKPY